MLFNTDTDTNVLKDRNSYQGCDSRYMPIDIKTPALFTSYEDTTLILLQAPEALVIEIISQQIADSFRSYFDEFWKKTKPFR